MPVLAPRSLVPGGEGGPLPQALVGSSLEETVSGRVFSNPRAIFALPSLGCLFHLHYHFFRTLIVRISGCHLLYNAAEVPNWLVPSLEAPVASPEAVSYVMAHTEH